MNSENAGFFMTGTLIGVGVMIIVFAITGNLPRDHRCEIDKLKIEHMRELEEVRRDYMIRMVKGGAAEWIVADDGTTTWSERKVKHEAGAVRVDR